ncbi:carboxypeptidase-like regulatory domain-containing protein [Candidatus Palauibacter sp.]|uniref:carboxypeptidase-like regulatory domain-containing protein n=1 Tax=Candidatus Palauibacter sp. TaxID=3101350 RepID=UPI003AF2E789
MTRYARVRAILAASLAFALLAPAVAAQEPGARLTGILVSERDGAPVDGAVVSLDGLDGVVVWETLSNGRGAFSLPLPPPGTYRVRVSRIGYESWASDTISVASDVEPLTLRLEIPVRPVPLPELMVTEQNNCPTTPEERRRAFELYESVLPILDSMSTAETRDSLLVRLERPVRIWKYGFRWGRDTVTVMVSEPLSNAPPGHMEAYGYADVVRDSMTTFYAPDGAALASPGFLATHCLSTAEAGTRAEITAGLAFGRAGASRPQLSARTGAEVTAGLAFEPRPGREAVDVRGVLWIDTVANEPRELEFNYTSLRPFLDRHLAPLLRHDIEGRRFPGRRARISRTHVQESLFGGHLRFERVAGDRWLIGEWWILRPRLFPRLRTDAHMGISVSPTAHPLAYSGKVLALFRRTDRSPR